MITKAWKNVLQRSGITDFRWHDLRHTWASWDVQSGTPIHVLQGLGGWSEIKMMQGYAHLTPEHLSSFANNISAEKGGAHSWPHYQKAQKKQHSA